MKTSTLISVIATVIAALILSMHVRTQVKLDRSQVNIAPFKAGETLRYKVKWGFIRLGTIEIHQEVNSQDQTKFIVSMIIRSASGIPLVNINKNSQSILQANAPRNIYFKTTSANDAVVYQFDFASSKIRMEGKEEGTQPVNKEMPYVDEYYDALGFLMLARCVSHSVQSMIVPMIMDYQIKTTRLQFEHSLEEIEVDAIDDEILARKFQSIGSWENKASGGMNGNFSCWVSADAAAVPLKAEMKIAVGSIKVELESYTRSGWIPGAQDKVLSKANF